MTAPTFIPGWEVHDAAGSFRVAWARLHYRLRIVRALRARAGEAAK